MKVVCLLTVTLLLLAGSPEVHGSSWGGKLLECICDILEDKMLTYVQILETQMNQLCSYLEANVNPSDPSYERILHFKSWILMKLGMIKGLIDKGASLKRRFPDICQLTQVLKFYLCVLIEWFNELRCELRELNCFLVYRYKLRYTFLIVNILKTLDTLDGFLLEITKCYKSFYIGVHCDSTWDGRKAGIAMGPPVMMNKEMADMETMASAFGFLDEDIEKTIMADFMVTKMALEDSIAEEEEIRTNTSTTIEELDGAQLEVEDAARSILTVEERQSGNMCSYTMEYRDFLCILSRKNQLLREKLILLEISLKLFLGPAYKFSKLKRYVDRLFFYHYKLDLYLLKIGLLYMDFFIKVHCDNSDCWCTIRGDPILKTCDQAYLYIQGAGWYTLASGASAEGCSDFQVYMKVAMVDGEPLPVKMVIYYKVGIGSWIKIEIIEDNVVIFLSLQFSDVIQTLESASVQRLNAIKVDGVQIGSFPHNIGPSLTLLGSGAEFNMVQTDCGYISFWYDPPMSRGKVHLDHDFFGKVSGLCGDYDGVKEDDLKLADGSPSQDMAQISRSYRKPELPPKPTE